MAAYPVPITTENFQTAWKRIARKQCRAMKKAMIRRISVMPAQLIFGCVFLVLAFGVIYETGGSGARAFLGQIPEIMGWCSKMSRAVLEGAPEETAWIVRCAVLLCAVPFCVALVPTALIVLLYHPIAPKQTGNMREDAWQLWGMAKRAREYTGKGGGDIAVVLSVLLGLFTVLFALGEQSGEMPPARAVLYGVAAILVYHAANLPLRLLLTATHFCYVPKSMVSDAEHYYAQCSQPKPAATENRGDA